MPRSRAPLPLDGEVLAFMIGWEHAMRTGASTAGGQPEHFTLPEQPDTPNNRHALELLGLCCDGTLQGMPRILQFLNLDPGTREAIEERMLAIVAEARAAAGRAAFPGCGPTTEAEEAGAERGQSEAGQGEGGAPPAGVPLPPKELAKVIGKSVSAVDSFLRRYREKFPDCYITVDDDDRRRNEPKYLYRVGDVLPALREHFGK
jgi:hypothetical protein